MAVSMATALPIWTCLTILLLGWTAAGAAGLMWAKVVTTVLRKSGAKRRLGENIRQKSPVDFLLTVVILFMTYAFSVLSSPFVGGLLGGATSILITAMLHTSINDDLYAALIFAFYQAPAGAAIAAYLTVRVVGLSEPKKRKDK